MASNAKRVALLARPGAAEARLVEVLSGAGVDIVLKADPTQVEAAMVLDARPDTLLVALDPPTEDALERLEAALDAPSVDVIFEEAALVVSREGWDAARWQRHLLAKLQGHGNVLPPAGGAGAGAGTVPAQEFAPPPVEASTLPVATPDALTMEAPSEDALTMEAPGEEAPAVAAIAPEIELEFPAVAAPVSLAGSLAWTLDPGPEAAAVAEASDVRLPELSMDDLVLPPLESVEASIEAEPPADIEVVAEPPSLAPVAFNPFDPVMAETSDSADVPALSGAWDEQGAATGDNAEPLSKEEQFKNDLASLELRIATMSLVDDAPARVPEKRNGAVLVLAGIGGPDAVRQLLGSLPPDFDRPVLVQQRLDGARYDRLVAQMQRATPLPVRLAEPGQAVAQATIYILPEAVGVHDTGTGLVFSEGGTDILAALPAADSAVLLLSGSDPACVDAALSFGLGGGLVIGQSADGCYDAAAPTELVARGGVAAKPGEMGARLSAHWQPGR